MIGATTAAYIGAAFIILAFGALLARMGLVTVAGQAAAVSRRSMATLRNPALDDDAKEAAMQADAKALFALFGRLTLGLATALALPMLIVWGCGKAGWLSFEQVLDVSLSWPFLLGGLLVFIVVARWSSGK